MAAKKSKGLKISLGLILFALVFVYLAYHMINYAANNDLSLYKVREITSLDSNDTFTGLIIRSEEVVNSDNSGYVNYFIANNSRCSVGDIAYSIDQNGSFNEKLSSADGTSSLSANNIETITNTLSNFVYSYDGVRFENAYNLRLNINNTLAGFLNIGDEASLKSLGVDTRYFTAYKSEKSGIIEYYTDGYEALKYTDVTEDSFDQAQYSKVSINSGDKISAGDSAYKLITDEKWSIIIKMDDKLSEKYSGKERLNIEFSEYGLKTTALFEEFKGSDGKTYGKFTLSKYMIQFAESRFLNITVINNKNSGLKIPKTALTKKDFYVVPIEYLTNGGNSDSEGFNVEEITTAGSKVTFKSPSIAYKDDKYVYISKNEIDIGSVIIKPESTEKAAISQTSELTGVYQVNSGYAIFKIVNIIDEDNDYVISSQDQAYGVNVYDMIILDSATISEGEKIY